MSVPSPRNPTEGERTATHCVVWSPRRHVVPPDLLAALARRGIDAQPSDSPYTTLALVCRFGRGRNTMRRAASSSGVLVLLEPRRLPQLGEVVDLVARFRPDTAIWVHEASDPRRLKALSALEVVALYCPTAATPHEWPDLQTDQPISSDSSVSANPISRLKFAPEPAAPTRGVPDPVAASVDRRIHVAQVSPRSLVTDEELAMLLAGRGLEGPDR